MQYFRCKCGNAVAWGSDYPFQCESCSKCGSNLATSPSCHVDPKPHEWYQESVATDNGPQPLTRCKYCYELKSTIEKEESERRMYRLGLDFGNVIKLSGERQPMDGVKEGIARLKSVMFGNRVYVVSRVDTNEHADRVRAFLSDNGFLGGLIPHENVFFCRQRNEKAPIVAGLGITHFVDDRTEVLSYMATVEHRFAMNPTAEQLSAFPPENMKIVQNWPETVAAVLSTCPGKVSV
jgi:hypothetical protein